MPRRGWLWLAAFLVFAMTAASLLHRGWTVLGTDFPNYYLLAHLRVEGKTVDRAYEWLWLQRQKDEMGLPQPLVGLGQITPFSAAALWPVAKLPVMSAKHAWMLANAGILAALLLLLRRVTKARSEVVLLLAACCVPLWRNFEYGQFYLLFLLLLLLAFHLHRQGKSFFSGLLIGVAAALKVFPLLFLLPSLGRRNFRAAAGAGLGILAAAAISIRLFGAELCQRYMTEVLPRGLRGDVADPYSLGNESLGSTLRRLFVFDPGLNPHPVANVPMIASALNLFAIALLLGLAWHAAADSEEEGKAWSLVVFASLLVSSAPASYQFVLLLFPVCFLMQRYEGRRKRQWLPAAAYLVAVVPWPLALTRQAWFAWSLPRWSATMALFLLLLLEREGGGRKAVWAGLRKSAFAGGLGCAALFVVAALRGHAANAELHFVGSPGALFEGSPHLHAGNLNRVQLERNHYAVVPGDGGPADQLSFAAAGGERWVEGEEPGPILHGTMGQSIQGQSPVLSSSGKELVFLREAQGQGVLYSASGDGSNIRQRTGADLDVYEATVSDSKDIYMAAQRSGVDGPHIYRLGQDGNEATLLVKERARYPAVSADGAWLAFSEEVQGSWQLRLLNLHNRAMRQWVQWSCNVMEPAWENKEDGSLLLLVSSDCGRGLGLTGIFEVRVPGPLSQ